MMTQCMDQSHTIDEDPSLSKAKNCNELELVEKKGVGDRQIEQCAMEADPTFLMFDSCQDTHSCTSTSK